jgi:two-component system OmpR family sensor kinase
VRSGLGRLPLRVRLVAGLVALVAVGLLVTGLAATSALRSYQLDRVDEQLAAAVDSPMLRGDGPRGGPGRMGPRDRLPGEQYVAVLDAGGAVVRADAADAAPDLPALTPQQARARGSDPFTVGAVGGDGRWRVLARALPTDAGTVVVATDLTDVDRTVRRLTALQVVIGLLVLLGVSGLGYVVVRTSLRGLVDVEEAAAAVAAGDLSRRVPERDRRTELGSLGASFNAMVSQVQSAFATRAASEDRLRRFVADASHELRTPLTSLRGFAELHRQGAVTDPEGVTRLLGRIEAEAIRMGLLVEDLLALARLDEQRPLQLSDVDLAVLAADAVHDVRAVDPDRPVTLEVTGEVPLLRGDEARLRQVLANLLGNAVQHSPAGTPVVVRLRRSDALAVVEVADRGPGMAPEVARRVFERFYRADASRTRASGGSGLGLSIVATLVEAHGGRVELDTAPGQGATFRVLLPVDGPDSQRPASLAPGS